MPATKGHYRAIYHCCYHCCAGATHVLPTMHMYPRDITEPSTTDATTAAPVRPMCCRPCICTREVSCWYAPFPNTCFFWLCPISLLYHQHTHLPAKIINECGNIIDRWRQGGWWECTCADAISVMREALTEVLDFMRLCRRLPSQHTYLRTRRQTSSNRTRSCGAAWYRVIRHSMVDRDHSIDK